MNAKLLPNGEALLLCLECWELSIRVEYEQEPQPYGISIYEIHPCTTILPADEVDGDDRSCPGTLEPNDAAEMILREIRDDDSWCEGPSPYFIGMGGRLG